MSVVTGTLSIHRNVEHYLSQLGLGPSAFKYLTVEEMVILFPHLAPLTAKAGTFKIDKGLIKSRVMERFELRSDKQMDSILSDHLIKQIYVMSGVFNYESSLQILSDVLGYGGYDLLPGGKVRGRLSS
jgi:hypothetical protein